MWIGVRCAVGPGELEVWSRHLDACGGSGRAVAAFLRDCAGLISTGGSAPCSDDRLREIERGAALRADELRLKAEADVRAVLGRALGNGMDMSAVAGKLGLAGFRAGGTPGADGRVMCGGSARKRAAALKPAPPVTRASVAERDARYAATWEAWACRRMMDAGWKMRAIASALELPVDECWRAASALGRHLKRTCAGGVPPPPVPAGWEDRYAEVVGKASGIGRRGARPVLNGTKGGMPA